MISAWLAGLLLLAAGTEALTGTVRVAGPAQNRAVLLRVDQKDVALAGAAVEELSHLSSARVEVLGSTGQDGVFKLDGYRILAVSGYDMAPLVGQLVVLASDGLALRDGDGAPISLNVSPATRARLLPQAGAKIWVYGKKLLSGELKVQVFGILRPMVKSDERTRRQ